MKFTHDPRIPWSPSSRRAWIEIRPIGRGHAGDQVALLAEGVDRNIGDFKGRADLTVALLAEGVDRNTFASS